MSITKNNKQVMEECQKAGQIRNLGLSNFNEEQIAKIIKSATTVPQVLQVELHAYFQQVELRKFCTENDIIVTAYAPLGSPGAKDHFVNKYNYRYVLSYSTFTLTFTEITAALNLDTRARKWKYKFK